jgi:hypothetical protein
MIELSKELKDILDCYPITELENYLDERKGKQVLNMER